MNEVVIYIEVNTYWLTEQSNNGEDPFSKVKNMISGEYPQVIMSADGSRLAIRNVKYTESNELRRKIKDFFLNEYKMSIADGDYNLVVKRSPQSNYVPAESEPAEVVKDTGYVPDGDDTDRTETDTADAHEIDIPELNSFLDEFETVIKNAKKYKLDDTVWATNILLSMDSGYGISTVNEKIIKKLQDNGYVFNSKTKKAVVEYAIPNASENEEQYWAEMLSEIEHYHTEENLNGRRGSNTPFIFCIDLSECLSEINGKKFHDNLQKLMKIKGSYIYVFRIPYVEEVALKNAESALLDIFLIRKIAIPPFSNGQLVCYLRYKLHDSNILIEENIDDLLEKMIAFEKKDGHFGGLVTVKKLANDITYKLLRETKPENELKITRKFIMDTYDFEDDTNPEETLAQLCGMENVKQTIDEIVAQIKLYKDLKKSGKKLMAPTMHMRFVGNPGTGKTTVARLVAKIFKENGILNKGYFYEIKARDLCGRYVGETAPKTSAYCRDALGSVLFIDEAYTLYHGNTSADYGLEAIETLITEMENNRDNLVVIMAGYEEEMEELLTANPGLKSRMPYEISFRNYTRDELIEIFFGMIGNDFTYTDGFDRAICDFIHSIPDEVLSDKEFSNARMIRNLYERIWSKAAYRKRQFNLDSVVLQEEDIQRAIADEEFHQLLDRKKKPIGF
jgi:SpoVK/Ycf46/Vps4 family AAA+-type ATPase